MFSADGIETVQQMFVRHSVWTSKASWPQWNLLELSVTDVGETSVSENGAENFKMAERTSIITIALFGTALQKGCDCCTSYRTDLENRRVLTTSVEVSIRNVDTFFHEKLGLTIRYLLYELVLFHRNYIEHCSCRTDISTNLCIPEYR
jgi:hypothetical protein